MTSGIKRSVAAAYQLKAEAHQVSYLIKYNQLLGLKSLGFFLFERRIAKK